MISFQNPGIIDTKAYTLMGASVKENDNPFGYFGTGLKYAIAVWLRNGCRVQMFRGLEETEFTARLGDMRGKPFNIVYAGEQELAFTLDLGKNWVQWQAMRELWCNAKDEGGECSNWAHPPKAGHTTFWVTGPAADEAWGMKDQIFLDLPRHEYVTSNGINIYDRPSKHVYFKGVRVFSPMEGFEMRFTYNFVNIPLSLSEDRVVKYEYDMKNQLIHALLALESPEYVQDLIACKRHHYEFHCDFDVYTMPSEAFMQELVTQQGYLFDCNPSLNKILLKRKKLKEVLEPVEPTALEAKMIKRGLEACKTLRVDPSIYPIYVTTGLERHILALANRTDKEIFLSRDLFGKGTKYVALALYEEYLHLARDLEDCSRELQTHLLEDIFTLVEQVTGEPL